MHTYTQIIQITPKKVNETSIPQTKAAAVAHTGNYRWVICALLFFSATINYVDRQVIGILKSTLDTRLGWTAIGYSWVVFSFQTAYAIGLFGVGRLIDRIGTRKGFSLAVIFCSVASTGHGLAPAVFAFGFS